MKLFGLIGNPLGHSFSKKYFTAKFEKENHGDCYFELFPLPSIQLFPELLQQQANLRGLAVTIPYKQAVIPYLTKIDAAAQQIGAVNCIQFSAEGLVGFNTDVIGFEQSLIKLLRAHHQKALLLGTGGASKAVQFVLNKLSIPFTLVSRAGTAANGMLSYEDVNEQVIETHKIIINSSPVGMPPKGAEKPSLPYQFVTSNHLLYDLVVSANETAFLIEGRKRGAIVKDGYEMLTLQAEENWRIWNNYQV